MKAVGALVAIVSLVVAVVMIVLGIGRADANTDGFARANFGCATTIEFDSGTYWIYEVGSEYDGPSDCTASFEGDEQVVTLADDDGDVALRRDLSISVDVDGDNATSIYRFDIDEAGDYVLRARTPGSNTSLAVGGDPAAGRLPLLIGGIAIGVVGVVLGAVMMRRGRRTTTTSATTASTSWPQAPFDPAQRPASSVSAQPASPAGWGQPPSQPTATGQRPPDPWAPPDSGERRG